MTNQAPWRIGMRNGHNVNIIYAEDGESEFSDTSIASVFGLPQNCTMSEVEGNPRWAEGLKRAHVMAAAPDLLESLKVMTAFCRLKYGNLDPDVYAEIQKAEAICAKAEGKTHGTHL